MTTRYCIVGMMFVCPQEMFLHIADQCIYCNKCVHALIAIVLLDVPRLGVKDQDQIQDNSFCRILDLGPMFFFFLNKSNSFISSNILRLSFRVLYTVGKPRRTGIIKMTLYENCCQFFLLVSSYRHFGFYVHKFSYRIKYFNNGIYFLWFFHER